MATIVTPTLQQQAQDVLNVANTLAPTAEAIAAATGGPTGQAAAALLPVALTVMQGALQLQQAGALDQTQLAALFSSIAAGVQSAHTKWLALNVAAGLPA